ncbi:hypothetical protein [Sphingomonas sp. Marseille-Q8236]
MSVARLIPKSIHARMILISGAAILVALLIAGWGLASALEGIVTRGLDQRLDSEIAVLASAVDGRGAVDRGRIAERRGLLEPEPGWRWRIAGPDGMIGSGDFPPLLPPHPPGPDGGPPPPCHRAPPRFPPPSINPIPPMGAPNRACAFMPVRLRFPRCVDR